jgi:murein DD-endopeptidase MepM/ murein hydrolase activator NlpD
MYLSLRNTVLAAVLMSVLLLSHHLSGLPAARGSTEYQIHQNERFGLTLNYPAEWLLSDNPGVVYLLNPAEEVATSTDTFLAGITLTMFDNASYDSLAEVANLLLIREFSPNAQAEIDYQLSVTSLPINNTSVQEAVMVDNVPAFVTSDLYLVAYADRVYAMTIQLPEASTTEAVLQSYEQTLLNVINSMTFDTADWSGYSLQQPTSHMAGKLQALTGFDYPVGPPDGSGWALSQGYGVCDQVYPGSCHAGEDWSKTQGATAGQNVYAIAEGYVKYVNTGTFVYPSGYPGAVVIVEHHLPNGEIWYSMYGHLGHAAVSTGQSVSRGQSLGPILYWPANGFDNSHLHFEIRNFYTRDEVNGSVSACSRHRNHPPGPGYWPVCGASGMPQNKGWVNPSTFINAHRQVNTDPCDLIEVGQGSSRQHLFQEAYNRDGGRANIGCPYTEAHWWHGVVIQDFKKEGTNEHVVIIHDELNDDPHGSIPAFVIRGDILKYYISQNGPDSSLGPPTTDEFIGYNGNPQSNFRGGYITKIDNAWQSRPWPERKEGYWYAEYRNGHNIARAGRACVVNESFAHNLVSADWGEHSSPYGDNCGVWADMFSMVWSRSVEFPSTGDYFFFAGGDDTVKIWLDGELLFDIRRNSQQKTHYVSAGSHEVVIEYQAHTRWDNVYFGFRLPVGDGSSHQAAFIEAYNRFGGEAKLGWPDNRAHWWGDIPGTVVIQDFTRPDGGKAAIIYDEMSDDVPGSVPAFVIQGDIWERYVELGGWESWLGVPTSDEFINADGNPQSNFRNGYIVRTSTDIEEHHWPEPQAGQWHTVYRNGTNLESAPSLVRNESAIDYDWGTESPGSGTWGIFADYFNIHWTKTISLETGIYEMQTTTDDGVRVSINGQAVIDEWHPQPLTTHTQNFRIKETGNYPVLVEYYEIEGHALAHVSWSESDIVDIPPLRLQQTNEEIIDIPLPSEPLTLPEVTIPFTPTNELPPLDISIPVTPTVVSDRLYLPFIMR